MKKIDKYEVRGLLGKGGMSTVYKVRVPVANKVVALKLFDPHPNLVTLLGRRELEERFTKEATIMARLRHLNLAAVWDYGRAEGKPFYTMEYYCVSLGSIMGETYRTEQPCRMLSVDRAIHYLRQILEGLCRLHHEGIVHRDIKPFNILVTEEDTVKLCDFGFSKLRGETFRRMPPNLIVGSPYYAAPEQEKDPDHVDVRADLYSVGVMAYRMLTGSLPYEECDVPSRCNPDLDEVWDAFLGSAVATEKEDRFGSAAEMLKELERLNIAWQDRKKDTCRLLESGPPVPESATNIFMNADRKGPGRTLRRSPIKVAPPRAGKVFGTDDLWRPLRRIPDCFLECGEVTVEDKATGLTWQKGGSDYPIAWGDAHVYIQELNEARFAGRSEWRLPTVDELMSLLSEVPHDRQWCIMPVFDPSKGWLWSSDRRSFTAAWCVNSHMGFIHWQDFDCGCFVRAVC